MKKNIEITREQAKQLYKDNESMRPVLLNSFTEEELTKKEITEWGDLDDISGYCISTWGVVKAYDSNYSVFATKEQAKSSLAKAQLSQLLKEYNGDWKPMLGEYRVILYVGHKGSIAIDTSVCPDFLAFETKEKATRFLELHRELIETYYKDIM